LQDCSCFLFLFLQSYHSALTPLTHKHTIPSNDMSTNELSIIQRWKKVTSIVVDKTDDSQYKTIKCYRIPSQEADIPGMFSKTLRFTVDQL
jgi:hypothetical protein